MPTFDPFRIFKFFPVCATEESANFFGYDTLTTSSSNLTEAKKSLPAYWLLHKIRFEINWSANAVFPDSGNGILEIVLNEDPNNIICAEENVRSGGDELFVNGGTFGWYNIEPFQNEKLHVLFYAATNGVGGGSPFWNWYITTDPETPLGFATEQNILELNSTIPITLPNSESFNLYVYGFFNNADNPEYTGSTTVTFLDVEWWEVGDGA